jgi:hypothetical protein
VLLAEEQQTGQQSLALRLAGPSVLLLIVVLFFWKLVLTNQYTWLESPDAAYLNLPWLQFQAGEWHHYKFPMWDPSGWMGQPLIGQAQPGAAYPPNWLLFLAPLKNGWIREGALHWYFVLTRYFAALACYALARSLGRSRAASVLAGCIYALGGYVGNTVAPQMVNGAITTPLVFLYLFRAERGERPLANSLLSGFFLGFGWLAGHHQMNLFVSLAAAGLWIWLGYRDRKMLRLGACSLAIAVAASAFQTIPMAEYGRRSVRWVGAESPVHLDEVVPYSVHQQYSLKPISVLGIFIPNIETQSTPYIGVAAFGLGLLGAMLAWRERQVRWLAAIGLGGLLFSLGPNNVFHGIFYSLVPLVEKARVPGAATLLFALGIAPLAAYGMDLIPRPENFLWSKRAGWILLIFAAIVSAASLMFFAAKISLMTDDRMMIPAIAAVLAAGILAGWRGGGLSLRAGSVCAVALALFEIGNVTDYVLYNRMVPAQNPYVHRLAEHGDLVAYIRNRGEAARIEYDSQEIPYNIGDWYGIETLTDYTASVTENLMQMDLYSPRAKDFFGVRYALAKGPPRPGLREVFTGRSGLKVFENASALPRAWSVHQSISLPGPKQISAAMGEANFNPLQTVLLKDAAPALGSCRGADEEVQMPIHQPNYVRINVSLKCRGMVILTDTWFPGWHATVDGKPAQIHEAYGGVRGVIADGGEHMVEMRYRPMSVIAGFLMTLAAALVTGLVRWQSA